MLEPSQNPSETSPNSPPRLFNKGNQNNPQNAPVFTPEMGHETGLALGRIGTPESQLRGGLVNPASENPYLKDPAAKSFGLDKNFHGTGAGGAVREATIDELRQALKKQQYEIEICMKAAANLEHLIAKREREAESSQRCPNLEEINNIQDSLEAWVNQFPHSQSRTSAKGYLECLFFNLRQVRRT